MATRMYHRTTGEAVSVHLFTGKKPNREPTREFVGRAIVIREGRFLHDIGYVYAGEWLVKSATGDVTKYTATDLHKHYVTRAGA